MNNDEKLKIYNKSMQSIETLKKAGVKVALNMSIPDRVYFTIQKLLHNRDKNSIKALNPGMAEQRRNIREELHKEEYTEKTNAVSTEHRMNLENNELIQANELVQENEQEIVR